MILRNNFYKYLFIFIGFAILIGCYKGGLYKGKSALLSKGEKPNVLLITIDTLRADHLGCYGYDQIKTPHIDKLANEGILFQHAYTPVPITLPSHASILTGAYPPFHGVRNNGSFVLNEKSITIAQLLKNEGYQTAAVVGAYVLDSRFGLDKGFEFYDDEIDHQKDSIDQLYVEREAEHVTQAAMKWLNQKGDAPFFLWVHYFDPHAMYVPPSPFMMEYTGRPYDGEIAYTDSQIGILLQYLHTEGELENTLVVLTADHGEGLGEHGEETHAIFLYDTTLHVPLIFYYPVAFPQSKKISFLVRTIDIAPSILNLLQFRIPPSIQGETLTGLIFHPESVQGDTLTLYCETYYPALNHGWSPLEGLRTDNWKYIQAPTPELYHLSMDANEADNLYTSHSEDAERIFREFSGLKSRISEDGIQWAKGPPLDPQEKQKLMSLGYVWTSTEIKDKEPRPDPKDMIGLLLHLNRAVSFYTFNEFAKAEEELNIILAQHPRDIYARFVLAAVHMKSDNIEKALIEYKRVASQDNNFMDIHNHLGATYEKLHQEEEALKEYNLAISLNPSFAEAYNNRGALYMKLNKLIEAREDFIKAVSLNKTFPEAYNNLGLSLEKEEKYPEAIKYFKESLQIRPDYPDAANNLGCVYIKTGDYDLAKGVLERIVKSQPDHLEAHNNLGIAYINLGNYDRAILELEETLLLDPNYIDAYISLGIAYFELGKYEMARQHYEKALQLDPENPQAFINMGILHAHHGNMDQAILDYQQAVKLAPDNLDARLNLVNAYREKGLVDEEIEEWKQILLIDQENLEALIGLGLFYVKTGKLYNALPVWQKITILAPDDPRGYVTLGDLYSQMELNDYALTNYRKCLELDPENLEGHLGLGALYYQVGDIDAAILEWKQVLSLDRKNTQAYFNLAAALTQRESLYEAVEAYNKLLEINSEDAEAHFYLGLVYEQMGQLNKAANEYRQALRISPDFAQAHMMLQRLEGSISVY